ncbi:MAG TPA: MerR family transcriptional regulator [Acidimicrobiia bacterium]|nr:MerR family transcriptional regulator [Acidimicrobiia bacterium]
MVSGEATDPRRLRVEELAQRAGVSVDTVRFYQKRRLLPPPEREGRIGWYGGEHVERLTRIRELQQRGFSLTLIRRLLDGELAPADVPLAAAVVDAGDRDDASAEPEEFLTLDDVAARSGVPRPLIDAVVREGLLVPRVLDDEPRFTPADVAIVREGLKLLEVGLPLPELLGLARRHHEATRAVAEEAVALFDAHVRARVRDSDASDDEKAQRLVDAFRVLLPSVTALVAHHFRRVLLNVAEEHLERVGEPTEVAAAQAEATRRLEIVWPA